MGTNGLSAVLFGRTRTAVLSLLYTHLDESFYVRQLMRETGAGQGAVQRELQTLANAGLILRKKIGNQVFYQANRESPVFSEISGLIQKTSGVGEVLRAALSPLADRISVAFVYGSIASRTEKSHSDVDLMVIGNVDFGDLVAKLSGAEKTLRREINPAVYTVAEWKSKLSRGNHFLQSVMKAEKVFVFGSPHELRELSPKRLARRASD